MPQISQAKSAELKILIRLPNWLGDVVMSSAFIAAVRTFYPEGIVDVVVKKELCDIAAMIPGVGHIIPFSKQEHKGVAGAYQFGKKLKPGKYDLYFNLPESLSSQVMAWASGCTGRVGFVKEGSMFLMTDSFKRPENIHRVDEYISLIEQYTKTEIKERQVSLGISRTGASATNKLLINFNSEASSRRMPIDKAIHISGLLLNTFKQINLSFIGSPQETAFIDLIINGLENNERVENLAGKTTLKELAGLMVASTALLTTDSGPAHLANSVGTPTIVLFGAGNEHNTAPYNKQDLTVIRYGKLPCEPCVKNTCKLYGIPKCLQMIGEMQIIDALHLLIKE